MSIPYFRFCTIVSPAAERIRFMLGEDDESPAPQLFTELDELLAVDGQEMEWKETASPGNILVNLLSSAVTSLLYYGFQNTPGVFKKPFINEVNDDTIALVSEWEGELTCALICKLQQAWWIKFEEKVEEGGERWSKPHVATLSLHSLFELRTCIEKGLVLLDLAASTLPQIIGTGLTLFSCILAETVIDNQIAHGLLKAELKEKVTYTLLRKHRHQTKKSNLRSLAEIGKTVPLKNSVPCLAFRCSDQDLRAQQSLSMALL
eukprot:g44128.t1